MSVEKADSTNCVLGLVLFVKENDFFCELFSSQSLNLDVISKKDAVVSRWHAKFGFLVGVGSSRIKCSSC